MNRLTSIAVLLLVAAPPASAFQHSDNATSWKTTEAAGNKAAQEAHFDEAERLLTTNLAVAENIAKTVGPEDDRLPATLFDLAQRSIMPKEGTRKRSPFTSAR